MPKIYADYGYDVHSVEVDEVTFSRVKSGDFISLEGQGFIYDDEGWVQDHWSFRGPDHPVYIILDNGAEFYCEKIWFEG